MHTVHTHIHTYTDTYVHIIRSPNLLSSELELLSIERDSGSTAIMQHLVQWVLF